MKLLFIIIIFVFFSCGKIDIPHFIDPYFNQYLNQFHTDSINHNLSDGAIDSLTVIQFKQLSSNQIGLCSYNIKDVNKFIDINIQIFEKSFYKEIDFDFSMKTFPYIKQYKLFLHEMGHCVYDLHHINNNQNDIMYPYLNGYLSEYYIDKFFTDAKNNINNWHSKIL